MKKLFLCLMAALAIASTHAQTGVPGQITTSFVQVRDYGSGSPVTRPCMLWLPADYPGNGYNPDYPLLVFFHGHGERGNPNGSNVNALKTYGPFHFLDNEEWDGSASNFTTMCGNPNYIVFAFQSDEDFDNDEIEYALKQLRMRYRTGPVIFTGASGGAGTVFSYAMELTRTYRPSHIIPMSVPGADFTNVSTAAQNGMEVWAFADDEPNVGSYYTTTTSIVSAFNNTVSNSAKFTGRSLGHCCWNDYYDPDYRETDIDGSNDNVNIYEWAMKRVSLQPIPVGPSYWCPPAALYQYGKF
ncbi:MAG TPA: hypothetical protein VEB42_11205, partial [Chitinophagaceae bacterium]|nr:hypothetical protein [Chitinophagaceae bacterium]